MQRRLRGSVPIATRPTTFTLTLPLTLAISDGMVVNVGDQTLVVPLANVVESLRPAPGEVKGLGVGRAMLNVRGKFLPILPLHDLVGAKGKPASPENGVLIVVETEASGQAALLVDGISDQRQFVIKSLETHYKSMEGVAGATILGDGRVVIILDIGTLVRGDWRSRYLVDSTADRVDRRTFALVVDDSITVRRVTQRLLERNGMRVMTAKDGVDAMAIMQEHVPDVILLDIEMPRMDGYEVAAQVRADARLSSVPIVMITSRSGEKHRARAVQLGVDDYLGKPYQENQLLDAIEPLVRRRREGA